MGLFSRKPDRELQAQLIKNATNAVNWFRFVLQHKRTNPKKGMEDSAFDLTIKDNRDAIRGAIVDQIRDHQLAASTGSIGEWLISCLRDALRLN